MEVWPKPKCSSPQHFDPLPQQVGGYGIGAAVLGNATFICGGRWQKSFNGEVSDKCFKSCNGTWQPSAGMQLARSFHTLTRVGHRLVATGGLGRGGRNDSLSSVEIYEPDRGWQVAEWSLNHADYYHCAVPADDFHLIIKAGFRGSTKPWGSPGMEIIRYNIDTGAQTSIESPPGAWGGGNGCVKDGDNIYLVDWQNVGEYKVFNYSLRLNEWIDGLPNLHVGYVEGMAVVAGELAVFDRERNVQILRDSAWVPVQQETQGVLKIGAVVVLP